MSKIVKLITVLTMLFVLVTLVACDFSETTERGAEPPPEQSTQNHAEDLADVDDVADETTSPDPDEQSYNAEVSLGLELDALIGNHYQEAIDALSDAGFTNIRTAPMEDLITGWLRSDGEVSTISINGNSSFEQGVSLPHYAEIVITHHSFPISRSRTTFHEMSLEIPSAWRSVPQGSGFAHFPTDNNSDGSLFISIVEFDERIPDTLEARRALMQQFVNEYAELVEFDLEVAGRYAVRNLSHLLM